MYLKLLINLCLQRLVKKAFMFQACSRWNKFPLKYVFLVIFNNTLTQTNPKDA